MYLTIVTVLIARIRITENARKACAMDIVTYA
jgi:hypothetical protein